MTTTANELKVGMTVKTGNVWIKIETIEQRTQKNGIPYVHITGMQEAGIVKRSNGWKDKIEAIQTWTEFKNATKVTTK